MNVYQPSSHWAPGERPRRAVAMRAELPEKTVALSVATAKIEKLEKMHVAMRDALSGCRCSDVVVETLVQRADRMRKKVRVTE